jgi:HK97 family phage major capsid protein
MSTPEAVSARTRTVKVPAIQYRECPIEIGQRADGTGGEISSYPLAFSSEAPVRRWDWDGEYDEILSHEPGDCDLARAEASGGVLPLLQSHQRLVQLGSVRDITVDTKTKRGRGVAYFDLSDKNDDAHRQESLVRNGHLKTVSVGYRVTGMVLASTDKKTGIRTYRCSWMPMEVSTEPIPADFKKVGIGRAEIESRASAGEEFVEFRIEEPATEGERTMTTEPAPAQGTPGSAQPAAPATPAPAHAEVRNLATDAADIIEMAARHNLADQAPIWIRSGLTPDQVGREILKKIATRGHASPAAESLEGMPAKDRGRYSVQRAIQMQIEIKEGKRSQYDGIEGEIHQERFRQRGGSEHGGILVPLRLRTEEERERLVRTLGTNQPTGGATLVGQTTMPDMIDLLRNRSMVLAAGAKFYPGLTGVVLFNKKTSAPTVEWMAENPASGATASEPGYGYVTLSPKTLIGTVQIPRQLLVMSSIDAEADIRSDLSVGTGLAIDLGAIHGTGTDRQPVGIYSAAGVQTWGVDGVPDLTDVTTMMGMLADKNADLGAEAWMTTPLMAAVLMRTQVVSGQAAMLWEGTFREGKLRGFTAYATNQISKTLEASATKHGFIFGNWNDLAVGMWGNELEIVVDVVTKAAYGQIVITSYAMADTAVLRGDSFVKGTGAVIA